MELEKRSPPQQAISAAGMQSVRRQALTHCWQVDLQPALAHMHQTGVADAGLWIAAETRAVNRDAPVG